MTTFRASMLVVVGFGVFFLAQQAHQIVPVSPWNEFGLSLVGVAIIVLGCMKLWEAGLLLGDREAFLRGREWGQIEGKQAGLGIGRIEGFAQGKDAGLRLGSGQAIDQDQLGEGQWTVLYFCPNPCLALVQRGQEATGEVRLVKVSNSKYILQSRKKVVAQKKDGHVYFQPAAQKQ